MPASDRSFQSKDTQRGSAGFGRPVVPDGNYTLEVVDSEASYWFQRSFAEALNGVEYAQGQQVAIPWSEANGRHVGAVVAAEVGRDWTNRQGESIKGQLESRIKRFIDHRPWEAEFTELGV